MTPVKIVDAVFVMLRVLSRPARFTAPENTIVLLPPMVTALLVRLTVLVRLMGVEAWSVPPIRLSVPPATALLLPRMSVPLFRLVAAFTPVVVEATENEPVLSEFVPTVIRG